MENVQARIYTRSGAFKRKSPQGFSNYYPPHGGIPNFIDYIEDNILSRDTRNMVLLGDLNLDLLKQNVDLNVSRFVEVLHGKGFIQCINKPTYFSSLLQRSTLALDHFWHNLNLSSSSTVISPPFSDHHACTLIFNNADIGGGTKCRVDFHDFSLRNKVEFLSNLDSERSEFALPLEDVNESVSCFVDWVKYLTNKYFPLRTKYVEKKI